MYVPPMDSPLLARFKDLADDRAETERLRAELDAVRAERDRLAEIVVLCREHGGPTRTRKESIASMMRTMTEPRSITTDVFATLATHDKARRTDG